MPPKVDGAELPGSATTRVHLLLEGVYEYLTHHRNGSHLDGIDVNYLFSVTTT